MFKRMDSCHIFTLHGFELDDGAAVLQPKERPHRRIEVFGDSVSCGMESCYDKLEYCPDLSAVKQWDFKRYRPQVVLVTITIDHDFMPSSELGPGNRIGMWADCKSPCASFPVPEQWLQNAGAYPHPGGRGDGRRVSGIY